MSVATPIFLNGKVQEELVDATTIPDPYDEESSGNVIFFVQPIITESGTTNYTEIGDRIRQAASLLVYQGSPSRTFSIDATFVSRTETEAIINLKYVNTLRSWRMPEKQGAGDTEIKSPSRLFLWGLNKQFKGIPVRMTDLNIPLNDESDYITTKKGAVPIVWNVSVTLKEARAIEELNSFDIQQFREGTLDGW